MPRAPCSHIDCHIGVRIRLRRTELSMSRKELGAAIGVTYQQISKYERGASRIAAALLYDIAHQLQMPIGYFYEGLELWKTQTGQAANPQ